MTSATVTTGTAPNFAQRFFMVRLPQHITGHLEKFAAQQGSIAFYVRGQGRWTLRMGNVEEPVVEGMAEDADLSLWFGAAAFQAFIQGTLDLGTALTSGELKFEGDAAVLERFGLLLSPPTSAIGTRFNR